MRIAVNTRFLLFNQLEGIGTFSHEVLSRLVKWHPEHQFIFIFDRPWHSSFCYQSNVVPIEAFPQARHPILFYWWFEWSIPKILKQQKADLFFSPDGYLSLRSPVKQVPVFHDLAFEHYPKDVPLLASKHYRYFFPRYAQKAERILTVSEFSKKDIVKQYGIDSNDVHVVYNGANEIYRPLGDQEIEVVREKHSQGKPYFLYVGALHQRKNITRLLKAYNKYLEAMRGRGSDPKKLLIVGRKAWGNQEMETYFESDERLKEQVHFTGRLELEELALVMGAAYMHINMSYFEGFGIPILESMKCGVPAITSQGTSMEEVGGDAVVLADPFSADSIAGRLIEMDIELGKRTALANNCAAASARFSWDLTADKVWLQLQQVLEGLG